MTKAKKKAERLVKSINEWHRELLITENDGSKIDPGDSADEPSLVTMDDFNQGFFPWQLKGNTGINSLKYNTGAYPASTAS